MKNALIRLLLTFGLLAGFLLFGYLVMCLTNVFRNEALSVADRLWLTLGGAYVWAATLFVSQQKDKLFGDTESPRD